VKPCDGWRESLIDLRYGLLSEASERDTRAHLAACAACAAEMESLKLLGESLAPQPGDLFGREAEVDWSRFAQRTVAMALTAAEADAAADAAAGRLPGSAGIAGPRREGLLGWLEGWLESLRLPAVPAWAAATAALVVMAGLAIMTYNFLPPGVGTGVGAGLGPDASPMQHAQGVFVPQDNIDNLSANLARQNTAEYITQTRAVLVSMLDVDIECDKDHVDISAERAKATELLRRQRLIASELHNMRAQDVCNDLEKLLLEVASLADCAKGDDIKTIRDVVEKRQILVRMELLSQELAKRGANA